MGDQLVVYNSASTAAGAGALVVRKDPEKEAADREKRIKDALELEAKLKMINDTIPTRVYNTSSSTAGAGSGDFHQYRIVRRNEQQRVKRIEEEWKKKQDTDEYETKKREREQQAEEATARRRAKRLKKKAKSKNKKAGGAAQGAGGAGEQESSGSEDEEQAGPGTAALD